LSRGNMSHIHVSFKTLDSVPLMFTTVQKMTLVRYILLPLNHADSLVLIRIFLTAEVIMKRRHTLNDFNPVDYIELRRKTAIHEAGHAAAIHFGNKQKKLPPVFFRIIINNYLCGSDDNCITKIEGGRLIHTLPSSIKEACCNFSVAQKYAYQQAFEADIINLLVGSLAEANYIAQRDNEIISPRLVPLNALHNYGGASDLEIINEYLQCFITNEIEQEEKITELFSAAFDFINEWSHWYAIIALADYMLENDKDIIDYEEVVAVLDAHFSVVRRHALYSSCRPIQIGV
jgi:hypothetical protein